MRGEQEQEGRKVKQGGEGRGEKTKGRRVRSENRMTTPAGRRMKVRREKREEKEGMKENLRNGTK